MTVNVPVELNQKFVDTIVADVLVQLNARAETEACFNSLPPYPNRKQVKQALHIGDGRLNDWINHGLQVIPFGKETRFDREDLELFLDCLKL